MIRPALFALGLLMGATGLSAQQTTAPASSAPASAPIMREISPGIFEYNGIRLDQKNHRIFIPASVNQREGFIEYLLVNEKGKVHESLFSTKVLPRDIHVALLLIGLKENARANGNELVPPTAIDSAYLETAPKLKGPPVQLSVTWTQAGKPQEVPAENWVFNLKANHVMTSGPWTYNGSMIENGVFLADEDLSIIAVITDPTALVNNPREGYDNDQIWEVREEAVPPLDTPVEISITLAESTTTKP